MPRVTKFLRLSRFSVKPSHTSDVAGCSSGFERFPEDPLLTSVGNQELYLVLEGSETAGTVTIQWSDEVWSTKPLGYHRITPASATQVSGESAPIRARNEGTPLPPFGKGRPVMWWVFFLAVAFWLVVPLIGTDSRDGADWKPHRLSRPWMASQSPISGRILRGRLGLKPKVTNSNKVQPSGSTIPNSGSGAT